MLLAVAGVAVTRALPAPYESLSSRRRAAADEGWHAELLDQVDGDEKVISWTDNPLGAAGKLTQGWAESSYNWVKGVAKVTMRDYINPAYQYLFDYGYIQWLSNLIYIGAILMGYYYLPRDLMLVIGFCTFAVGSAFVEAALDVLGLVITWASLNPLPFTIVIWLILLLRSRLLQRVALWLGLDKDDNGRFDWKDVIGYFGSSELGQRLSLPTMHRRLCEWSEEQLLDGTPSLQKLDLRIDRLEDFLHTRFAKLFDKAGLPPEEPLEPLNEAAALMPKLMMRQQTVAARLLASGGGSDGARQQSGADLFDTRLQKLETAVEQGFAALGKGTSAGPGAGVAGGAEAKLAQQLEALSKRLDQGFDRLAAMNA